MIFVSVGSVLPFDRLVRAVDEWAGEHPETAMFCQIGNAEHEPRHATWARELSEGNYRVQLERCSLFVAHVGMGSILQALEVGRPMILMPRRAACREVTTDHQLHTAERLKGRPGLTFVEDADALKRQLDRASAKGAAATPSLGPDAGEPLVGRLRAFIASAPRRRAISSETS